MLILSKCVPESAGVLSTTRVCGETRPSRQTAFCVRQHHSSKWSFHYYSFLHRFSNNMALKLNQVTSANLTLQVWKSKTVSLHSNIRLNVYQTCSGKLRTLETSIFLKNKTKKNISFTYQCCEWRCFTHVNPISQDRKLPLCIKGRETVWIPRSPQMKRHHSCSSCGSRWCRW